MKRMARLISLLLAVVLLLAGCSSGSDPAANASVKIAVTLPYVLEGAADELKAVLENSLPELNTDEKKILVQAVNTGDPNTDPMSAMAAMTKLTTMFLGKEIEVMICDADNAQRHGEGGRAYVPVDQLFTAEEQAELGISTLTVSKVDENGSATGEMSGAIGISLADCEGMKNIFRMTDLGLYVIAAPETEANLENIRSAIRCILSM